MLKNAKMIKDAVKEEGDKKKGTDEITMNLLREIGNSVQESIQLKTDYPSKNVYKKLPILDLDVWIGKINGLNIISL